MNQLKHNQFFFFGSTIMLTFGETKVAKEKSYAAKKTNKYLGC